MIISGIEKLTLLDYPGKVACTVFTTGCNMRCPFCHNSGILSNVMNISSPKIASDLGDSDAVLGDSYVIEFLKSRIGKLDGVCITGGEPTLQSDLKYFIKEIKDMGFLVKLDTNGTRPEIIQELIDAGLIDYIAMDIKNSIDKYDMTAGVRDFDTGKILKSIDVIIQSGIEHEFRTTIVRNYHTEDDIRRICTMIEGCRAYYLQKYTDRESVLDRRCEAIPDSIMHTYLEIAREQIPNTYLRGVE